MKKLIILSTIYMTFLNCSVKKTPEFIGVENIKVLESTSKNITFTANAMFKNPNIIGGQLQTNGIKVIINDKELATVSTENFKVPAKKEFSIPLKTKVSTDSIFSNKNLSSLLGSLFNKKIKVQYKGEIKYKILGFSHRYSIDKTEDVKIKF